MCNHCDKNNDKRKQLIITSGESIIDSDDSGHCIYIKLLQPKMLLFETFIEINYCPMCGRKLEV